MAGVDTRDQDDLFRYTSGRWLINEEHQQKQRYITFNISNLCSQAAALFGPGIKCVHIIKLEGNFNKAFLLMIDDGNKVIAKIPCPNAGTPLLIIVSEVATLKFLQSYLSIRVPEVYAWSSNPTNPVGAKYIIMEKILIDGIMKIETELESLKLPAYRSLFLQDSLLSDYLYYILLSDLDPTGVFYVGPSYNQAVYYKPCRTLILDFTLSLPYRELARAVDDRDKVQRYLNRFIDSQSVNKYYDLLRKAMLVLPVLSGDPRHTNLHLRNIYISSDDPTTIEGVINWQSAQAVPLFIQAQFPEFLRPPKTYSAGTEIPSLPENYEELNPDQKEKVVEEQALAA
ncbi:hypothetical protein BDV18DRAFT_155059 [Aspergillus unguis]